MLADKFLFYTFANYFDKGACFAPSKKVETQC